LAIWHSGQAKLREKAEATRHQAEQIAGLSAENERLSNQVAKAKAAQSLTPEELSELLRLRGQVGRLRQTDKEEAQLEATNAQLRAARAAWEKQVAEAQAAPNFWAKEQLAFAGYADPEATLKTVLWAMNTGDVKSYLAGWASGDNINVLFEGELRTQDESELAAGRKSLAETLSPSIGFHILDKKVASPDQVILNLSFDGEGKARRFVVQKTGDEWRLTDILRPGQNEP
jgi:multidrug efflux pump subunit AcrA (membrane-fusion protein)